MAVSASLAQLTAENYDIICVHEPYASFLMLTSTLRKVQKYQMSHLAINVTTT